MKKRELPEGWEIGTISEFSKSNDEPVQTGPFGAQLHASDYVDDGVPLILIKNVYDGKIVEKNLPRVSSDKANALIRYRLKKGDIVFSRVGSVGRVAVVQEHQAGWLISGQMLRVRLENPEIDSKFLNFMIQTNWFSQALENEIVGTTRKSINTKILSDLPLIKPPISVQRQIVAILEQAEAVKRQRQEADALTGALLQSVFYEMFGDLSTNEKGWDLVKLESICTKITDGTHVTPTYIEKGVPFLSVRNLTKGYLDFDDVKYISESEHQYITKRSKPVRGDILLTKVGVNYGIAEIVDVETEFSIFVSLALLKPKFDLVDPCYLKHCINTDFVYRQAKNRISGIGVPDLHLVEIKQFDIPLPPLALQQQFARVVQEVVRIREQQAASGKEIEGLCEGLMQRVFEGELIN